MKIPRNLLLLYISSSFMGFAFGYFRWVMPLLLMGSVDTLIVGTVFAFSSLIGALVGLSGGVLSDRTGRRFIIVLGTIFFALGATLLFASLVVPFFLVIGSVLVFVAPSFYIPAVDALIAESIDADVLGRAFSVMPVITLGGMALGSAVLGYVDQDFGLPHALFVGLVCTWVAVLFRMCITESSGMMKPVPSEIWSVQVKSAIKNKILIIFAIIVMGKGLTSFFGIYFPSFLSDIVSLGEKDIGLLFSILLIGEGAMQPVAGWFIDRFDEKLALGVNLGGSGVFVLSFLFFSRINPLAAIFSIVISSSLSAFYNVGYSVYIAHNTRKRVRGAVYGGMGALFSITSVPAPILGAILWERSAYLPFVFFAVVNIVLVPLLLGKRGNE